MTRHTLLWTIAILALVASAAFLPAFAQEAAMVLDPESGEYMPAPADAPYMEEGFGEEVLYDDMEGTDPVPVAEEESFDEMSYDEPAVEDSVYAEPEDPADFAEPDLPDPDPGMMMPADEVIPGVLDDMADLATNEMAELIELKPDDQAGIEDLVRTEAEREGLISVTLDNVPLQDVVRMFARISGANIVSGTNLQGTVTVSLKDVEWQPALRTILDTANMTLMQKSPGIYSVVSKSEAAGAPVTIDTLTLRFTTVSNVLPIVSKMLISSNASVAAFPSANTLIVQETAERLASIKEMVERIDQPRPQVFIEAKFVELNDDAIRNLGINWQSLSGYTLSARDMVWNVQQDRNWQTSRQQTWDQFDNQTHLDGVNRAYDIDGVQSTGFEGPGSFDTRSVDGSIGRMVVDTREQGQNVGLNIQDTFSRTVADTRAAVLSAADFQVTLSALQQESGVSVVSNPRIIVASGESAKIHVGRKDPNYVTREEAGTASGTVITKRELSEKLPFIETGVKIDVLPTVNTKSNITVKIVPELSRSLTAAVAGDIPPIITRTITSEFNLESGRTVAIGGLTSTDDRETVTKVPVLGDIPLIGRYLFRHTSTEKAQEEVIIFVTVGLASPESLNASAGIPSEGRLIHRHLAKEATRVEAESLAPAK